MEQADQGHGEVTRWLSAAHDGDGEALQRLLAHVYDELRAMAHGMMAREGGGATLEATALVHELWLRLERQESVGFQHRAQFFGAAAQMMRRILVDHARRRSRKKNSDEVTEGSIDQLVEALEARSGDLLVLEQALERLARNDPRKARLVELRFFAGLPMAETAEGLDISLRQAERDWTMTRAWLKAEMDRIQGS